MSFQLSFSLLPLNKVATPPLLALVVVVVVVVVVVGVDYTNVVCRVRFY